MDKEIFIRQAKITDVPVMAAVVAESWKTAYATLISEEDIKLFTNLSRREELFKNRLSNGDLICVLLSEGMIKGVCSVKRYNGEDFSHTAEIDQLYLSPSAMGKGMGGKLLSFTLESLEKMGFKRVILYVMEGNEKAAGFYRHMGFKPDGFFLVCENLSQKNRAFRYIKALL